MTISIKSYLALAEEENKPDKLKLLTSSFDKNKSRYKLKIYIWKNYYIFHVKIPSDKSSKTYDVILELTHDNSSKDDMTDYPMRVFSNSPSFIYRNLMNYNNHKCFCDWMSSKCAYYAKPVTPTEKTVHLEKTIYLAVLYIKSYTSLVRPTIATQAKRVSTPTSILANVKADKDILTNDDKAEDTSTKTQPTGPTKRGVNTKGNTDVSRAVANTKSTKSTPKTKTSKKSKKV